MMFFRIRKRTLGASSCYLKARASRYPTMGRERGQALIEYVLVVSVAAMIALGGFSMAGGSLQATFSDISGAAGGVLQPNTTGANATTTATTTATTKTKKKKSH